MTHKARWILTLAVSALALAGCQSTKEAFRFGDAKNPNPGPCPNAQALFDAARIVKIDGEEAKAHEQALVEAAERSRRDSVGVDGLSAAAAAKLRREAMALGLA